MASAIHYSDIGCVSCCSCNFPLVYIAWILHSLFVCIAVNAWSGWAVFSLRVCIGLPLLSNPRIKMIWFFFLWQKYICIGREERAQANEHPRKPNHEQNEAKDVEEKTKMKIWRSKLGKFLEKVEQEFFSLSQVCGFYAIHIRNWAQRHLLS